MSIQKFPSLNYYFGFSTIAIWENDKGEIETSERERYYCGEQSEFMFKEQPEDGSIQHIMFSVFTGYKKTLDDFLRSALRDAREKSLYKSGQVVNTVEPYQRMTKMKVEQIAGILSSGKVSCAYIGRMIKSDGNLTNNQVICLEEDLKDE